jgi:uncharacterized protein (TIGR02466 family)
MPEVVPLFSKPVFLSNIDSLSFDLTSVEWIENYGNFTSESKNVLEKIATKDVTEKILDCLYDYFYGIQGVNQSTQIHITESWLNKTEPGQYHHRHWHPNSIISGVVCISNEGNSGALTFITSNYDTLEFETSHANVYNSKSWSYTPKTNDVILFPSSVEHLVEKNNSEFARITLSFNTFVCLPRSGTT